MHRRVPAPVQLVALAHAAPATTSQFWTRARGSGRVLAARRRPGFPVARRRGSVARVSAQSCSAMATALNSAEALLTVSWYSEAGTESATTPAPAWMWIWPSLIRAVRSMMHVSMLPS